MAKKGKGKIQDYIEMINPELAKRFKKIEKILKDYDVKITTSNSLLETHIIKFNEISNELKERKEFTINEIKGINDKLDKILNIKVNGIIGLENALTLVVEATVGARSNIALFNSIKNWTNSHRVLKAIITSRITLAIISAIVTFLLTSIFNIKL